MEIHPVPHPKETTLTEGSENSITAPTKFMHSTTGKVTRFLTTCNIWTADRAARRVSTCLGRQRMILEELYQPCNFRNVWV
jgi:hypothetical protein